MILLTGKATLAGLPARIDYRKAASSPAQITLTATLDDAARKKRGLDFGGGLNGPVSAEIRVQQTDAGPRYGVDVDFAAARVKDLLPGWQKAAGRPGKASFIWVPKGDGGTINDFALDSGLGFAAWRYHARSRRQVSQGRVQQRSARGGRRCLRNMEAVGDGWKLGPQGQGARSAPDPDHAAKARRRRGGRWRRVRRHRARPCARLRERSAVRLRIRLGDQGAGDPTLFAEGKLRHARHCRRHAQCRQWRA